MDVLLLEKIQNLGDLGARVSVRPGYGRNYLIPHGKALPVTDENLAMFEKRRAELTAKAKLLLDEANKRAESLNALEVLIRVNASEEGRLYGSVGPLEIVNAVNALGHEIEKKEVLMPEGRPLHSIGTYTIHLQLHSDVVAECQVVIEAA